jgi:hypothetical protein
MESVEFKARALTATLASGRKVRVARADDGQHWGFQIGDLDSKDDLIRFALTPVALDALLDLVSRLRGEAAIIHWLVKTAAALEEASSPEASA